MIFNPLKEKTIENLEILQSLLNDCVAEGLFDPDDHDYNEIFDLLAEAKVTNSLEELAEVVEKAKTLEIEIAAWFSKTGKTTLSLSWPKF